MAILQRRKAHQSSVKSGTTCHLLMEVDEVTFKRHIRLTRGQFDALNNRFGHLGMDETPDQFGGMERIPLERKTLMFLWYMANNNSFREISDKFDVSQGSAHAVISQALECISNISSDFIQWPNACETQISSAVFKRLTGLDKVIEAIDGCHIKIQRPHSHGIDYLNRKGYYSVLLQGTCDDRGKFNHFFVGLPGRVHDARMLRLSPLYQAQDQMMGENKLLSDTAYIAQDFPFISTPRRDNGQLTHEDRHANAMLSRGRVIIENAFGRMKCRFRRIRDVQNVNLITIVRVIIAACTLHNICFDDEFICDEHPNGCPRNDDNN